MNTVVENDRDIEELISCPKIIKIAPKDFHKVNSSMEKRFKLYGKDNDYEFNVFISYSVKMPNDFSLGLIYNDYLLIRCNGFHGTTKSGFYTFKHHAHPHAHILTMDDINNGRSSKPSKILDLTGEYINLKIATAFFCEKCGIIDYDKYFNVSQLSFDDK